MATVTTVLPTTCLLPPEPEWMAFSFGLTSDSDVEVDDVCYGRRNGRNFDMNNKNVVDNFQLALSNAELNLSVQCLTFELQQTKKEASRLKQEKAKQHEKILTLSSLVRASVGADVVGSEAEELDGVEAMNLTIMGLKKQVETMEEEKDVMHKQIRGLEASLTATRKENASLQMQRMSLAHGAANENTRQLAPVPSNSNSNSAHADEFADKISAVVSTLVSTLQDASNQIQKERDTFRGAAADQPHAQTLREPDDMQVDKPLVRNRYEFHAELKAGEAELYALEKLVARKERGFDDLDAVARETKMEEVEEPQQQMPQNSLVANRIQVDRERLRRLTDDLTSEREKLREFVKNRGERVQALELRARRRSERQQADVPMNKDGVVEIDGTPVWEI